MNEDETTVKTAAPADLGRTRSVVWGILLVACLIPTLATAQMRGVQRTPDGVLTLVNSDVGNERWAITRNDDGTLTGNVFRTDGPPAFVFCAPGASDGVYACSGADACTPGATRGAQRTPDGARVLINRDVGNERWAIGLNPDGSATGNVFRTDGPPAFIVCEPGAGVGAFSCSGADACTGDACGVFAFIADVVLPDDFFTVPEPCEASFGFIADIALPGRFFEPPALVQVTLGATTPLQAYRLRVSYPVTKGTFSGSAERTGCRSDAGIFAVNDLDDGTLLLAGASASPLPFPLTVSCTFEETTAGVLAAPDLRVDVLGVTADAQSGDPAALTVDVSLP